MVKDACHYLVCQRERAPARRAIHDAGFTRADRIKKRAELGMQRFFRRGLQLFESDSGLRAARLDANAQRVLPSEIERNVFVLLEESHLADALGRDAAR